MIPEMSLRSLILGTRETIAGTVYGTIVVMATITGASKAAEPDLLTVAEIAAVTTVVFWIAHVYSRGLGESLALHRRLTWSELVWVGWREGAIIRAAVLPILALVLGAAGVWGNSTALWVAVGVGVATLTLQGLRYARLESLSLVGEVVTIVVNVALGLAIVLLKVYVLH